MSKRKRVEEKKETTIHPISLVFNYIDDFVTFCNTSLVCKEWKNILDKHKFWQNINERLGYDEPRPRAKKYKTHHSIFVKNIDRTCYECHRNFYLHNQSVDNIFFKLHILEKYCNNRLNFKVYKHNFTYKNFVEFVKKNIIKLSSPFDTYKRSRIICEECKDIFLKEVEALIEKIKMKKNYYEKEKRFCNFVYKDFVKIIIRNLYNTIDETFLYIERFGGTVKYYNYKEIYYIDYDEIKGNIHIYDTDDADFNNSFLK
jgi:hypothetical protein